MSKPRRNVRKILPVVVRPLLGVLVRGASAEKSLANPPDCLVCSPNVATSLENYAGLLYATGRPAEADMMVARAMAIRVKGRGGGPSAPASELEYAL